MLHKQAGKTVLDRAQLNRTLRGLPWQVLAKM